MRFTDASQLEQLLLIPCEIVCYFYTDDNRYVRTHNFCLKLGNSYRLFLYCDQNLKIL